MKRRLQLRKRKGKNNAEPRILSVFFPAEFLFLCREPVILLITQGIMCICIGYLMLYLCTNKGGLWENYSYYIY